MFDMRKIKLDERINYTAFFLTLSCNLSCPYCINLFDDQKRADQAGRGRMSGDDWIKAANRLELRDDLPLTLQGGEPTISRDFYRIVNEVKGEIMMDLLTNMMFDPDEFIANVPVWRFSRPAKYAAIRVSYHPGQNDIDDLIYKTRKLTDAGFRIGIYGILVPDEDIRSHILSVQERCTDEGIDFRTKEFLGDWGDSIYGRFRYPGSVGADKLKKCICRTSELIVDPVGEVYRCHSDLYRARGPIGHILDDDFGQEKLDCFRECEYFGQCNPCDVKVTTNRFQQEGHTSVEIKGIQEPGRRIVSVSADRNQCPENVKLNRIDSR